MLVFPHQNTIHCTKSGGPEVCIGPGAPGPGHQGRARVRGCLGVCKEVSRRFFLCFRSTEYVSVACFCLRMSPENMSSCFVWVTDILTESDIFCSPAWSVAQERSSGRESRCWPHSGQERFGL